METKFTPGPWRTGECGGCVVCDTQIPGTEKSGHGDVEHYGGHLIAESIWRAEDTRLIAAAPELFEALKNVLDAREKEAKAEMSLRVAEDNYSSAREEMSAWESAIQEASAAEKAARAALAKATGEQA